MDIFRHDRTITSAGALLQAARGAACGQDRLELLLALAQLECGLEDAGWRGGRAEVQRRLSWAARAYLKRGAPPSEGEIQSLAENLPDETMRLELGSWEGIEHYGLWPAGYAEAAREWRARHPETPAWVLGLRSAGSYLAPIVAEACGAEGWMTARPVGDPHDRRIELEPALRNALAQRAGAVLVVDEGPGLSGSSIAAAVRTAGPERTAVICGWQPTAEQAAGLRNAYAAAHWNEWEVYAASPLPPPEGAEQNLSGGAWRGVLHPDRTIPVWATHERLKHLADGGRTVIKFAGWGERRRRTRERAQRLAEAGWGPRVRQGDGSEPWVRSERIVFAPLRDATRDWCEQAGRYLAWVGAEFGSALDGRMLRWEWGKTAAGWVKFDGTDHHDDPFQPGPAGIAWDVAAVAVEFGAEAGEAVARAAGCRLRPEQAHAYRKFRRAWCAFAAEQTSGSDRDGFGGWAAGLRRGRGG